jgi:hypothetical protein
MFVHKTVGDELREGNDDVDADPLENQDESPKETDDQDDQDSLKDKSLKDALVLKLNDYTYKFSLFGVQKTYTPPKNFISDFASNILSQILDLSLKEYNDQFLKIKWKEILKFCVTVPIMHLVPKMGLGGKYHWISAKALRGMVKESGIFKNQTKVPKPQVQNVGIRQLDPNAPRIQSSNGDPDLLSISLRQKLYKCLGFILGELENHFLWMKVLKFTKKPRCHGQRPNVPNENWLRIYQTKFKAHRSYLYDFCELKSTMTPRDGNIEKQIKQAGNVG